MQEHPPVIEISLSTVARIVSYSLILARMSWSLKMEYSSSPTLMGLPPYYFCISYHSSLFFQTSHDRTYLWD